MVLHVSVGFVKGLRRKEFVLPPSNVPLGLSATVPYSDARTNTLRSPLLPAGTIMTAATTISAKPGPARLTSAWETKNPASPQNTARVLFVTQNPTAIAMTLQLVPAVSPRPAQRQARGAVSQSHGWMYRGINSILISPVCVGIIMQVHCTATQTLGTQSTKVTPQSRAHG